MPDMCYIGRTTKQTGQHAPQTGLMAQTQKMPESMGYDSNGTFTLASRFWDMLVRIREWLGRKNFNFRVIDSGPDSVNVRLTGEPRGRTMAHISAGRKSTSSTKGKKPMVVSRTGIYQFTGSNGLRVTMVDPVKLNKATANVGGKRDK